MAESSSSSDSTYTAAPECWFGAPLNFVVLQTKAKATCTQLTTCLNSNSVLMLASACLLASSSSFLCVRPFRSFIALICDNFEAAPATIDDYLGASILTTAHKWTIHQKTHSSSLEEENHMKVVTFREDARR